MSEGAEQTSMSKGKIAIVTGANSGIGYEIAKGIAMYGATVIMACRSEDKANNAIQRMQDEFEEAKRKKDKNVLTDTLSLEYMQLDLSTMQSVIDFADTFKKSGRNLHILFCNAGMGFQPFALTPDGFETVLQVNYLAHFVLIAKLLPVMRQSGSDCRILMTSSRIHKRSTYDYNTIEYKGQPKDFPTLDYYGRSKMYQIMQMICMVRRLAGFNVTVTCICPGMTKTNMGEGVELKGYFEKFMLRCVKIMGQTPAKAARPCIQCSVHPQYEGVTGLYYEADKQSTAGRAARDEKNQETVWNKTFELVGQHITADEKACLEGQVPVSQSN